MSPHELEHHFLNASCAYKTSDVGPTIAYLAAERMKTMGPPLDRYEETARNSAPPHGAARWRMTGLPSQSHQTPSAMRCRFEVSYTPKKTNPPMPIHVTCTAAPRHITRRDLRAMSLYTEPAQSGNSALNRDPPSSRSFRSCAPLEAPHIGPAT